MLNSAILNFSVSKPPRYPANRNQLSVVNIGNFREHLSLYGNIATYTDMFMRAALLGSVAFSCMLNVLGLVGPLFMLEIYDRVIPSKSIPTLVALVILMLGLYAAFGLLEITRRH